MGSCPSADQACWLGADFSAPFRSGAAQPYPRELGRSQALRAHHRVEGVTAWPFTVRSGPAAQPWDALHVLGCAVRGALVDGVGGGTHAQRGGEGLRQPLQQPLQMASAAGTSR